MSNKSTKINKSTDDGKNLNIRDVPEEFRHWLKVEAVKRKMTMGDFFVEICTYWQENHKP